LKNKVLLNKNKDMIKTISTKFTVYTLVVIFGTLIFFKEGVGINAILLIFSFFTAFFVTGNKLKLTSYYFFFTLSTLLSAVSVLFIHSTLSILCLIAFALLSTGYRQLASKSAFVNLLNSLYSVLTTPIILLHEKMLNSLVRRKKKQSINRSQQLTMLRFGTLAIPLIGFILFMSLYASANPLFAQTFDELSFNWLPLAMFLAFILAGIFYYHPLKRLNNWCSLQGFQIVRKRSPIGDKHPLSLKFELRTAVILLFLLNMLLFIFNA